MAVIKSFDRINGHILVGDREMTLKEAVSLINLRRERGDTGDVEIDYVGEKGALDIDIEKLGCPVCQNILRSQKGKER